MSGVGGGLATTNPNRARICFRYDFHPVGQGLFCSGEIWRCSADGRCPTTPPFRWVYDCGTSSRKVLLTAALDRYLPAGTDAKPRVDLLVLSHFDQDHVNGVVELLGRCRVGRLFLPYVPLHRRLAWAFGNGVPSTARLMEFYVNPARYLASRPGAEIDEIVYVEGPATPAPGSPAVGEELPPDDSPLRLDVSTDPVVGGEALTDLTGTVQLGILKPTTRSVIQGVWEFVFYNDERLRPRDYERFRKKVERDALRLLDPRSRFAERKGLLAGLKKHYVRYCGSSAKKRNDISLFVFGRPLAGRGSAGSLCAVSGQGLPLPWSCILPWFRCGPPRRPPSKLAILYTGDGSLASGGQVEALTYYLGTARLGDLGVLQVMHHGSEGCWHPGLARTLSPCCAVFSSDPDRDNPGHPDLSVWNDFKDFGPVQVDRATGCTVYGELG